MKKTWFIGLFGTALFPMTLQAQQPSETPLTLPELITRVSLHSKAIKIQDYKTEVAHSNIEDAKNARLPDASFNAAAEQASNFLIYDNGLFNKPSRHDVIHTLYSTNTNVYLTIYEGLKLKNTIRLKELEADFEKQNLVENKAAITLTATLLFLDLYLQKEWEQLMLADMKDKEHQLKEIKDFHELGVVLQSDVLRAELELSKRRMTLIEIQNQQKKLNQQLNVIIGFEDEQRVSPQVNIDQIPVFESFQSALNISSDHAYAEKLSALEVAMTEKKYELTKSANSIKLGIGGSFQFSNPQIFLYPYNPSWYTLGLIGLKASYPISEIYKNKYKKQAAKIAIEEVHMHHEKTRDDIRTKIYQDYLSLDESVKYIAIYQLNEEYAQENARILKDAYFNQTALITDLLDADVQVLKSKFELKQSKINSYKNYYKLQYSKGSL